jgi:hypothetical protein
MQNLQAKPSTDTGVMADWDDCVRLLENPVCEKAKGYYDKGHMRLEMLPVSFDRGNDRAVIIFAVNLFTATMGIPATGLDTTTFRKSGMRDCQPDVSYYLGNRAQV